MNRLVILLILVAGKTYAQSKVPAESIRLDSMRCLHTMPNARPSIGFYRNPKDPANVIRSTLDNMPVKVPDTSIIYTMPQQGYDVAPPKSNLILPRKRESKP